MATSRSSYAQSINSILFGLLLITSIETNGQCSCTANLNIGAGTHATNIVVPSGGTLCVTGSGGTITSDISWQDPMTGILCFSGTVNFTGSITTGYAPAGRMEIQAGGTLNYTPGAAATVDFSQYDYTFLIVNSGTFNFNTTNNPTKYLDLGGVSLTNNGTMGVTGNVIIKDRNKPVTMNLNAGSSLTISGGLEQAGTTGGIVTTINNNGSLTALAYWQHGVDASNVFNNNTGSTFTLTGTDAQANNPALWPSSSGAPAEAFKRQQGTFSNFGTVHVDNGTIGFYGTTVINVNMGRFYSQNLILPSTLLNAATGCSTFIITNVLNINFGITYSGDIFIYDNTYTTPNVTDNNDQYASKLIYCGYSPAPSGCGSTNNDWITKPSNLHYLPFDGLLNGCEAMLPLSITFLHATQLNDHETSVEWSTVDEESNSSFEVERSNDGIDFVSVGEVQGKGNAVNTYHFVDHYTSTNIYYYRIKESNTATYYSNVVAVNPEELTKLHVDLFPNPSTLHHETTLLVGGLYENSHVEITMTNSLGNSIFSHDYFSENNAMEIEFDKDLILVPGVYVVTVNNQQVVAHKKLVVE